LSLTDNQNLFNQYMREVDTLIKQGNFDQARLRLADAKRVNPSSPYIVAFEERIKLFEKRLKEGKHPTAGTPPEKTPPAHEAPAVPPAAEATPHPAPSPAHKTEHPPVNHDALEKKVREQVEQEYKQRLTEEIHHAEANAAKTLELERTKLERQQGILKTQYEQRAAELHKRLEGEYKKKLDEEVRLSEERLKQQFEKEQSFFEGEIKARLVEHHTQQQNELEERLKREQAGLLEKERTSFEEKERKMREEFNKRLLESLRKTETVFREQGLQQQQMEQQKIRENFEKELEEKLSKERESLKKTSDDKLEKLKESTERERKKLEEEYQRQLHEEVEQVRKREAQDFEKKRVKLVQDLEAEHQRKYQEQLIAERRLIQAEADGAIGAERKKLHQEREAMLSAENEKLEKLRADLRAEMEKNLMTRLEQLSVDYERRMELLGFTIPKTKEECLALYREKLAISYTNGEPSVDEAEKLMELKELLELTYDDHVKVETDVRMEKYVQDVEKGIISGDLNLKDAGKLESLKEKFRITPEEASRLEPYILSRIQRLAVKGRILVADDEPQIREAIKEELEARGYQAVEAESVNVALEKLKKEPVDIIVSDISFLPREPDGFKFFKLVQEQPELRQIPFIFLSALNDDVIVRSGMQLGADDYLTKPIDFDLLLAVIEGKLRRVKMRARK